MNTLMNEYYLLIQIPEHISLQLKRTKTLYFEKTGDETVYKYPSHIVLGKTELKDPPHARFTLRLNPKNKSEYINGKNYLTFSNNEVLEKLQNHFNIKDTIPGIWLGENNTTINFSLPEFEVSKYAIMIKNEDGFIVRR